MLEKRKTYQGLKMPLPSSPFSRPFLRLLVAPWSVAIISLLKPIKNDNISWKKRKDTWVQTTVYTVVWALFMPLCGDMVAAVARSLSADYR
jgi:hypothetical protein